MAAWSRYGPAPSRGPALSSRARPRAVPAPAVLLREEHQVAARVDARGRARGGQLHEGEEPPRLGLGRHQLGEGGAQAEGLRADLVADEPIAFAGGMALVEDKVDHREHGGEAPGQLPGLGHRIRQPPHADLLLGADDALGDGRLRQEEGARDLAGGQPADEAQGQRHLALRGQRGMAAGEDQPEAVVSDGARIVGGKRLRPRAVGLVRKRLDLAVDSTAAAQVVARAVARNRHQPGAGVVGQPVGGPVDQGRRHRLLHRLLGGVEVAEHARHRGDEPAVLAPEDVLDEVPGAAEGRRYISQMGRTSMKPYSPMGSLEAHSTASALEAQSIR